MQSSVRTGHNHKIALIVLCIGVLYCLFYGLNSDDDFKPYRRKLYDEKGLSKIAVSGVSTVRKIEGMPVLWSRGKESAITIEGLEKGAYILAMRLLPINRYEKGQVIEFLLDGTPIMTVELKNSRRWQRYFFTVPHGLTSKDKSLLTIVNKSERLSPIGFKQIEIKNFLGSNLGILKGYLLLDGHYTESRSPFYVGHSELLKWGVIIFITLLYWRIHLFLLRWFSKRLSGRQINVSWRIFLPGLIIVVCFGLFSLFTQYHILYPTRTFLVLTLVPLVISQYYQFLRYGDVEKTILLTKRFAAFPAVAAIYLFILIQYSGRFDGNVTGFIVIGDYFKSPLVSTDKTFIYRNNYGYDGQFYYYIAHDPFIKSTNYDHIDLPTYRYGRIGYPLLVNIFSLGTASLMPYMMLMVNIGAVLGGMWFVMKIAGYYNDNSGSQSSAIILPDGAAALIYGLIPGLLLSTLRCLPEPVALFFITGGIFFYLTDRDVIAASFLSAAVLSRETSFIAVIAVLAGLSLKRDFKKAVFYLMPFGVYLLWQLNIFSHFGTISQTVGTRDMGFPFKGIATLIDSLINRESLLKYRLFEVLYVSAMASGIAVACVKFFRATGSLISHSAWDIGPFKTALFLYALLAVFLNYRIWIEPWSYARVTGEFVAFLFVGYLRDRDKLSILPLSLFVVAFFAELFWLDISL